MGILKGFGSFLHLMKHPTSRLPHAQSAPLRLFTLTNPYPCLFIMQSNLVALLGSPYPLALRILTPKPDRLSRRLSPIISPHLNSNTEMAMVIANGQQGLKMLSSACEFCLPSPLDLLEEIKMTFPLFTEEQTEV